MVLVVKAMVGVHVSMLTVSCKSCCTMFCNFRKNERGGEVCVW